MSLQTRVIALLIVCFIIAGITPPAAARQGPEAWNTYLLNMRSGPGTDYAVIATLQPGTGLQLEARNDDLSWVLVRTEDGSSRGWLAGLYVRFAEDVRPWNLPVSGEIVAAPAVSTVPAAPASNDSSEAAPADYAPVPDTFVYGGYQEARYNAIDVMAYPEVPTDLGRAREIFLAGQAMGRNPNVISKVGDCMTIDPHFLVPLAGGIGVPPELAPVVARFGESFTYRSYAADTGYSVIAALAWELANPSVCNPGETPLQCEYRVHNSSVAVIMLGSQDLIMTTPAQYDAGLRHVVEQTINAGVIPLLSTFPRRQDNAGPDILYNQIVIAVAQDYNIPMINLWAALEYQRDHGLTFDKWHLSEDIGFPVRNSVTLRALNAVMQGAMY